MISILSEKSVAAHKQYDYITDNDNLKVGDFVLVQVDRGSRYSGQKPEYHLAVAYVRETLDGATPQAKERVIARVEADSLVAEERKKIELKALEARLKQLDRDEELAARYARHKDRLSDEEREKFEHALGLTTKH